MEISDILCNSMIGISELKKNPMKAFEEAEGAPLAVLNRNKPVFYLIPADNYEALLDRLEDYELADEAREALETETETVKVSIDEL